MYIAESPCSKSFRPSSASSVIHHSLQPSTDTSDERRHQRHGAVLNDRVTFVAGDHPDMEEAAVLGLAHGLEKALMAVAVVLRGLHDRDVGIVKQRDQFAQPGRLDLVVAVDHADHLGGRVRACASAKFSAPALNPASGAT